MTLNFCHLLITSEILCNIIDEFTIFACSVGFFSECAVWSRQYNDHFVGSL